MDIGETIRVRSRAEWRTWLSRHHADRQEIWLVYYKKGSGKAGISYDESVEEALCFGWVDGQTKGLDAISYAGRFTPRRPGSNWSASNRARAARLLGEGRMTEAGRRVLPADLAGAKNREGERGSVETRALHVKRLRIKSKGPRLAAP